MSMRIYLAVGAALFVGFHEVAAERPAETLFGDVRIESPSLLLGNRPATRGVMYLVDLNAKTPDLMSFGDRKSFEQREQVGHRLLVPTSRHGVDLLDKGDDARLKADLQKLRETSASKE